MLAPNINAHTHTHSSLSEVLEASRIDDGILTDWLIVCFQMFQCRVKRSFDHLGSACGLHFLSVSPCIWSFIRLECSQAHGNDDAAWLVPQRKHMGRSNEPKYPRTPSNPERSISKSSASSALEKQPFPSTLGRLIHMWTAIFLPIVASCNERTPERATESTADVPSYAHHRFEVCRNDDITVYSCDFF